MSFSIVQGLVEGQQTLSELTCSAACIYLDDTEKKQQCTNSNARLKDGYSTHRLTCGWRRVWCSKCHPQAPHEVHIGVVHISFFRLPWDCSCHGKLRISLAVIDTKICSGAHWHRPTTNTFRVQLGWATLFYNHGNPSKARHDKLRFPCNYGDIWWYMHLYLEPKIPKDHTATEAPNEKHRLIVHSQDD